MHVARILLVDDDKALLDMLAMAFSDHGHSVSVAHDGAAAYTAIRRDSPELSIPT